MKINKILLFYFSVRSVMHKYLEKKNEVNFDKIFHQTLGRYVFDVIVHTGEKYLITFLEFRFFFVDPELFFNMFFYPIYYKCRYL